MPYQLGTGSMDTPDDSAHEEEIDVEDGDIIVAGTDGLFDNVYPDDIEKILKLNKNTNPKKLASNLAKIALINAKDESYYSPFAKAVEMMGSKHQGGKYDDITVVVAKIQRDMST
ncbi:Protein phosphatase 2C family protein [Euphorbia peplus]|nr:Protein phosphatase 2C family protein [Euphorbia peplus]